MESRAKKDITGCRSGRLVAIEPSEEKRNGATLWRCRCDCGKEILLEPYQITGEKVKSCGCLRSEKRIKDLTGQRFGKLTALERLDEKSNRSYLWRCVCDCGNEVTVRANALTSGNTKSCGCAKREAQQERAKDIRGKRYGLLTAIRPTEKRRHASVVWECQCDCGRRVEYSYIELEYSHILSCGCEQHPSVQLPMRIAWAPAFFRARTFATCPGHLPGFSHFLAFLTSFACLQNWTPTTSEPMLSAICRILASSAPQAQTRSPIFSGPFGKHSAAIRPPVVFTIGAVRSVRFPVKGPPMMSSP